MRRIIVIVLLACLLASCTVSGGEYNRFIAKRWDVAGMLNRLTVIVDTKTNVQYLLVRNGEGAGLTVMVDADGKPLLWDGGEGE